MSFYFKKHVIRNHSEDIVVRVVVSAAVLVVEL